MAVAQKRPMKKVSPSFCQEVILELALFSFFVELNMVWETHVMFCMTELDFSNIMYLLLKMGKIGQV